VKYLKENPDQAIDLYIAKTSAPRNLASRAVTELNKFLIPSGRGSGQDLVSAVEGNWKFTKDSGAIPAGTNVNIQQVSIPAAESSVRVFRKALALAYMEYFRLRGFSQANQRRGP
jgi:hypothetical protein